MITFADQVDGFLKRYFAEHSSAVNLFSPKLLQSMEYSLFTGGKRFRPSLCLRAGEVFNLNLDELTPYAAAIELIHTYSLIHDDLPCMDDDDYRRGQPTNHKKFGEPLALLAGDALLTEAFQMIAQYYRQQPDVGISLIQILARAAGATGMVGGQAMDMHLGSKIDALEKLMLVHKGKTAALIASALEGVGAVARLQSEQIEVLRTIGELLGIAFQIKDDILDDEKTPNSVLFYWGHKDAQNYLDKINAEVSLLFTQLPRGCEQLNEFFMYNQTRNK